MQLHRFGSIFCVVAAGSWTRDGAFAVPCLLNLSPWGLFVVARRGAVAVAIAITTRRHRVRFINAVTDILKAAQDLIPELIVITHAFQRRLESTELAVVER